MRRSSASTTLPLGAGSAGPDVVDKPTPPARAGPAAGRPVPNARELYRDWSTVAAETVAAETVAMLRLDAGRHPDDPLLSELITQNPRVNRGFSADVSSTTASTRETFLADQGTHAGRGAPPRWVVDIADPRRPARPSPRPVGRDRSSGVCMLGMSGPSSQPADDC
ncbi:hypothetical protein RY074_45440 [Streptomyces iranensis]|nr:hypothetical protein [Streptomyces iranensis]